MKDWGTSMLPAGLLDHPGGSLEERNAESNVYGDVPAQGTSELQRGRKTTANDDGKEPGCILPTSSEPE